MVILVLTRAPWSTDNNAGNTLNNLFVGLDGVEFHSLYLREGAPKNDLSRSSFHITEQQILTTLHSRRRAGRSVDVEDTSSTREAEREHALYARAKRWDNRFLWFAREVLWRIGRWRGDALDVYLQKIRPDIVFMPAFDCIYPYRVLNHVLKRSGARSVLYHTDDNLTLRQLRFSPVWWLARLWLRRTIKTAARTAALNYCITDELRTAYAPILKVPCDVLRKPADFGRPPTASLESSKDDESRSVRFCYTGNISAGRWETLHAIGEALDATGADAVLEVFSHDSPTPRMRRAFDECRSLVFMSGIPSEQIPKVQSDADVLVHVESLRRRGRLATRRAFSTKLVDYFLRGRCILAVGWSRSASIAYLLRNDAAVVATTKTDIDLAVGRLLVDSALRAEYAVKAWECGRRNHERSRIQSRLRAQLAETVEQGGIRS